MTAGEIQGLRNWSDGGGLVTIGVGEARNQADSADLALLAPTTVSVAVSGIGGLDAGTIVPNKLYALYVVKVGATVGGILSTSFGGPSGVASFRRVGAVMTNANSQIVPFTQAGNKTDRLVEYQGTPNVLLTQAPSTRSSRPATTRRARWASAEWARCCGWSTACSAGSWR